MLLNFSSGVDVLTLFLSLAASILAIFVAVPFHEFAHAFVAKREGDYTAVAMKRYTLAFHSHFNATGFFCLLLFGFGWAKPVPVDERNFKHGKRSKFLVSIAGVVTNLILGIVFLFIYCLIYKINPNFYDSSIYGQLLYYFLNYSVSYNFMLAIFNLLPIYPFDGYRIVECFSKTENAYLRFVKKYSFWIYLIIIVTGIYSVVYQYIAGSLIDGLIQLFSIILGL